MRRWLPFLLLFIAPCAQGAISRSGSCAGTNSCTLSAVNTGDLVLVYAFRNGSITAPSLPASNTSIVTVATTTGGTVASFLAYCRKASSGSDTGTGTATNATNIVAVAYSGTSIDTTANCPTTAINVNGLDGKAECTTAANCFAKTSTTTTYRAITTSSGNTSSWVVGFQGGTGSSLCTPTGMTAVTSSGTAGVSDTNTAVASWAAATCSVTSETWMMYDVEVIAASPTCSSCTPTIIQASGHPPQTSNLVSVWKHPLPNGSVAGNALVVGCTEQSSGITLIATDDHNNTWFAGPLASDTTNNQNLEFFVAPNVAANTRIISVTFSSPVIAQCFAWEVKNIATANVFDGTSNNGAASGTAIQSGSITTTVDNDLIFQIVQLSNAGTQSSPVTWTKDTGFNLTLPDQTSYMAAQAKVQTTHGAINPTLTNNFSGVSAAVSCTMALKGASVGGSLPAGIKVQRIQTVNWPVFVTAANITTITLQVPTSGNLIAVSAGFALTSLSSSPSNTWTAGPSITNGLSHAEFWYAANATSSEAMTITINFPSNATPNFNFYDIIGAATSPFDVSATASGTSAASSGPITGSSISPTTANGLVLGFIQEDGETVTAVSPGLYESVDSGVYSNAQLDDDAGLQAYYNASSGSFSTTWTYSNYESGTAINNWADAHIAFKAAVAASGCGSISLLGVGCR